MNATPLASLHRLLPALSLVLGICGLASASIPGYPEQGHWFHGPTTTMEHWQSGPESLLLYGDGTALAEFVRVKQREYNLGVVEVFAANGDELVSAINPEIPAMNFSRHDSDLVRSGLMGGATWRTEEVGSGDVIRGPKEENVVP